MQDAGALWRSLIALGIDPKRFDHQQLHALVTGYSSDPRVRARAQSAHSMCVGDVVVTPDGQAWRVLGCGWEELPST